MGPRRRSFLSCLLIWACSRAPAPPPNPPGPEVASERRGAPLPTARTDASGSYTLTGGSKRLLASLKRPLKIELYVTPGLDQLEAYTNRLTALLSAYQHAGGGKVSFELIEVTTPALRERALQAGVQQQAFERGAGAATRGLLGVAFAYGDRADVIPALSPALAHGLEFWISIKIRSLRDGADGTPQRIGVIANKQELELDAPHLVPPIPGKSPSIQGVIHEAFPYYAIEEVDLKGGTAEVGRHLDALIVTQPRQPYSEQELRRLDEFLLRGGKGLAVYASAVTLERHDPKLQATLCNPGLDRLLSKYGIQMNRDAVFDFGSPFELPYETPSGATGTLRHPGIARVVPEAVGPFFLIDEILFPFPSSLTLLAHVQPPDVKVQALAWTTSSSSVETAERVALAVRTIFRPRPPFERRVLAATVQGRLASAFEAAGSRRAPTPSRVLVVSSSYFLANPFVYAGGAPGAGAAKDELQVLAGAYARRHLTNTILSFKNTLDWLTVDPDLLIPAPHASSPQD